MQGQTSIDLAGKPIPSYPGFLTTTTFNWDDPVFVGLDPELYEGLDLVADIYITEHRTPSEWTSDPELIDVRGAFQSHTFLGASLGANAVEMESTIDLPNLYLAKPGVGYDIVLDIDQDGLLSEADFIDGNSYVNAGFYLVGDLSQQGPYEVATLDHSSAFFETFIVYYPSNIEQLEAQPLIVISHGWTHEYWFYDYIGELMASYGYIVMSHRNDVGNGGALYSDLAAIAALENIDLLFSLEETIGDGILAGKIDNHRIIHAGHSTGGECVVRAYKRLLEGDFISDYFSHEDILLVNSIAPVAFLNPTQTNPEGANYHQFLGGADTDVSGAAVNGYVQALSIYERGHGNKSVVYIHGAGHTDFHNSDIGPDWTDGPDLIGKEGTQSVVMPYFLALTEWYAKGNPAMKDFLTRSSNEFRPSNIGSDIVISNEYRPALDEVTFVIDDFQTNNSTDQSSSGGAVYTDLPELHELLMQDFDGSFEWSEEQWNNGMTRARFTDEPYCAVLAWEDTDHYLSFDVLAKNSDWSSSGLISLRACQITRHPLNEEIDGPISFALSLSDADGTTSTIDIAPYGVVAPPYPRSSGGYLELCVENGTYSVIVGGSTYEEEMSFVIPGYLTGEAGTYEFTVESADPCTEIEVLMYDSWGDGWDNGTLQIVNSDQEVLAVGTLGDGFDPDTGSGWQNEFHTIHIELDDFLVDGSDLDLSNISELRFDFGPSYGSSLGAIGLDDIMLYGNAGITVGVESPLQTNLELSLYPNPIKDKANLKIDNPNDATWSYSIYNAIGALVFKSEDLQGERAIIHTGHLAPGLYLLEIGLERSNAALRFTVE